MAIRWRLPAFAAVTACFFLQAAIVWRDAGPRPGSTAPLSPQALAGQAIFRAQGCQGCHALYGMGGSLGPDLTNAAARVPPQRFAQLLQQGAGPMPAYHLDAPSRAAVWAYLQAVDATGRGTPAPPPADAGPLFAAALQRWRDRGGTVPADVAAGATLVAAGACGACHRSFAVDPQLRAPDLSLARRHLSAAEVATVLAQGRGSMPAMGLERRQTAQVQAFLAWLAQHRDAVAPQRAISWGALPWFAYGPSAGAAGAAGQAGR